MDVLEERICELKLFVQKTVEINMNNYNKKYFHNRICEVYYENIELKSVYKNEKLVKPSTPNYMCKENKCIIRKYSFEKDKIYIDKDKMLSVYLSYM